MAPVPDLSSTEASINRARRILGKS